MLFGLQPLHMLVVLVVALLIFGPARLPELGRALGKTMREFQSATRDATQSLTAELQAPVESTRAQSPAEAPWVQCKNCGTFTQPGTKFCPECGTAQ